MTSKIRVHFADFWNQNFDPSTCHLTDYIAKKCDVVSHKDHCDLVVCSLFGRSARTRPEKKLLYSGENFVRWEHINPRDVLMHDVDYCIGTQHESSWYVPNTVKYLYMPLGAIHHDLLDLDDKRSAIAPSMWHEMAAKKRDFCSFIASNNSRDEGVIYRNNMFNELNKLGKVASGGKVLNNIGRNIPVEEHNEFLSNYKYNLCFENSSACGYVTEKIINAYMNNTVPIYWGHAQVHDLFNKDSMIYASSPEHVMTQINMHRNNPRTYSRMLSHPSLTQQGRKICDRNRLHKFIDDILDELK